MILQAISKKCTWNKTKISILVVAIAVNKYI